MEKLAGIKKLLKSILNKEIESSNTKPELQDKMRYVLQTLDALGIKM